MGLGLWLLLGRERRGGGGREGRGEGRGGGRRGSGKEKKRTRGKKMSVYDTRYRTGVCQVTTSTTHLKPSQLPATHTDPKPNLGEKMDYPENIPPNPPLPTSSSQKQKTPSLLHHKLTSAQQRMNDCSIHATRNSLVELWLQYIPPALL